MIRPEQDWRLRSVLKTFRDDDKMISLRYPFVCIFISKTYKVSSSSSVFFTYLDTKNYLYRRETVFFLLFSRFVQITCDSHDARIKRRVHICIKKILFHYSKRSVYKGKGEVFTKKMRWIHVPSLKLKENIFAISCEGFEVSRYELELFLF